MKTIERYSLSASMGNFTDLSCPRHYNVVMIGPERVPPLIVVRTRRTGLFV